MSYFDGDTFTLEGLKTIHGDGYGINARRNVGEPEKATPIGLCCFVAHKRRAGEHDLGPLNHGARRIFHCSLQAARSFLAISGLLDYLDRETQSKRQGKHEGGALQSEKSQLNSSKDESGTGAFKKLRFRE